MSKCERCGGTGIVPVPFPTEGFKADYCPKCQKSHSITALYGARESIEAAMPAALEARRKAWGGDPPDYEMNIVYIKPTANR